MSSKAKGTLFLKSKSNAGRVQTVQRPNNNIFSTNKRSFSVEKTKHLQELSPIGRNKSLERRIGSLRSKSKMTVLEDTTKRKVLEETSSLIESSNFTQALICLEQLQSPDFSPDVLYKKAICYSHLSLHKETVEVLLLLIQDHPSYCKDMYTLAASSFISLGDQSLALKLLGRGLEKFPRWVDGYLQRAQLFNKSKKWDKAVSDYYSVMNISPSDGRAYLGLSEALIGMGDKKRALKMLGKAIHCKNTLLQALTKRAVLLFQLKDFDSALNDIQTSDEILPNNPETLYYKALIYFVKEDFAEAALCLEQVIKYDADKKYTGAAIYNLGAVKIKQRDFYGAFYTFQRSGSLEVAEQKVLKLYVEAVLFLIKRQFEEGISLLSKIVRDKNEILRDYLGKSLSCRAFGHASLGKHSLATRDLIKANKLEGLEPASRYNLMISQGILLAESEPKSALSSFKKASFAFPGSIEPLVYQACICLKSSVTDALDLLDAAIEKKEMESELYFFRGIAKYTNKKPVEAVTDIEAAIERADDNVSVHFLVKGLCYATVKLYQEAFQDFSIAIQLDETCAEAYLYRGKCAFILGDNNLAFMDYQRLIMANPDDPNSHIHAGDLLAVIGSYAEAIQAYENANDTAETSRAYVHIAKCKLMLRDLEGAVLALQNAFTIEKSPAIKFDLKILKVIANAHDKENLNASLASAIHSLNLLIGKATPGKICGVKNARFYKGVFLFYLGEFCKARNEFKAVIEPKDLLNAVKDSAFVDKDYSEILYNVALCCIMEENYEEALLSLSEIIETASGKERGKLMLLKSLVLIGMNEDEEAKSTLKEAVKFDEEAINSYLDDHSELKLLVFSATSRYAGAFPLAVAKISRNKPILIRPSFNLPKINIQEVTFEEDLDLSRYFNIQSVKCKPEPPWLNRVQGAIQFTEELHSSLYDSISELEDSDEDLSTSDIQ